MPISHFSIVVLRTKYAERVQFYTKAVSPLGYTNKHEIPDITVGFGDDSAIDFWVSQQKEEGQEAAPQHFAFKAKNREMVSKFHEAALAASVTDNRAPGPRPYSEHYYAAFILDPCGNNVEAACTHEEK